jgi:hypothetical protein
LMSAFNGFQESIGITLATPLNQTLLRDPTLREPKVYSKRTARDSHEIK